jgi:hypothetical protein
VEIAILGPCARDGVKIVLISLADGRTEVVPVGSYLASYTPEGDLDACSRQRERAAQRNHPDR